MAPQTPKTTPGSAAPMPSLPVQLPPYVVHKERGGRSVFYFQVPRRLRPEGWAGAYRLPLEQIKRTGTADPVELAAVIADGEMLYKRLTGEKAGHPEQTRLNTLPWLIQAFDNHLRHAPRETPIAKKTLRQYDYAARAVRDWSEASGHPHVKLITRPAIIAFLDTMNATPTKRKHVAGYIRGLMFFAMDKGIRTDNPAIKLKISTPEAKVHIWSDDELLAMVAKADEMNLPNVATAMLIAHDEGPRPCDVLEFRSDRDYSYDEGAFRYFQTKTDEWVTSPAGQRVRERLSTQPRPLCRSLIINANTGKRYNERVFQRDFDRVRTALQLHHLQFRYLRHTFCVKCKRAGLDAIEIASKTGHSPKSVEDMLRKHYLPHDSEVAINATAKIEAYRLQNKDRKNS